MTVNGALPTKILYRTAVDDSGLVCEWRLPSLLANEADRLVLQAILIMDGQHADMLDFRINVFEEEGLWQARVQTMGPETVDGHADKVPWGRPTDVDMMQRDGDSIVAFNMKRSEMDGRLLFSIPTVSVQIYRQTFRRIAGDNYMDIAERAIMPDGLP